MRWADLITELASVPADILFIMQIETQPSLVNANSLLFYAHCAVDVIKSCVILQFSGDLYLQSSVF